MMNKSVSRMSALINDVLDLARGRLGGGLTLERAAVPLEPVLRQVVAEMQMTHPSQIIETNFQLTESVIADRGEP